MWLQVQVIEIDWSDILKYLYLIVFISGLQLGCQTPWKPLVDAEIISMTRSEFKAGTYKSLGPVSSVFCFDMTSPEKALTYDPKSSTIGLVDEVVMLAQQKKRADGIMDAQIEYKGRCVKITGTAIAVKKRRR